MSQCYFFLFAGFAVCTAASAQEMLSLSPVQAKLILPDRRILPGVPFEGWIEVYNPSDATVAMGLSPRAVVVTPQSSFETEGYYESRLSDVWASRPIFYLELRARERKTLTLPLRDTVLGAKFFGDERMSGPGLYKISLRLDSFSNPMGLIPAPPTSFRGSVLTDEVTLERIQPTGDDAKIWERMQELAKGHWKPDLWFDNSQLLDEVLVKHPDSKYTPYALLAGSFGARDKKYLKSVMSGIDRFPDSPVSEVLDVVAAELLAGDDVPAYNKKLAKLRLSKRPTTRLLAFGREDQTVSRPEQKN